MAGKWEAFGRVLDRCESPIEWMFAHALLFSRRFSFEPTASGSGAVAKDRSGMLLGQQVEVGRFRIDFTMWQRDFKLAIEIDGHEFHHATKEQVNSDNDRDMDLTRRGWRVVRFSGSRVRAEAYTCAKDAHDLVLRLSGVRLEEAAAPQPKAVEEAEPPLSDEELKARAQELLDQLDALK
jgi:very-short-patch-repair endonuclease